ncbi:MAG: four helix bundle protein [Patescibacteria group bacterium]
MKNFKELIVWQKAMVLVVEIYRVTKSFPDDEKFGLTSQMRRSGVSIPSNIAEGHMRTTNRDFRQFVAFARGSCSELETQARIAQELGYLSTSAFIKLDEKITEVAKMLSSFYAKL